MHGDDVGNLPASTLPRSLDFFSSSAACVVAACSAYAGGMPASTMYANSLRVLAVRVHRGIGAEGDLHPAR